MRPFAALVGCYRTQKQIESYETAILTMDFYRLVYVLSAVYCIFCIFAAATVVAV